MIFDDDVLDDWAFITPVEYGQQYNDGFVEGLAEKDHWDRFSQGTSEKMAKELGKILADAWAKAPRESLTPREQMRRRQLEDAHSDGFRYARFGWPTYFGHG